MNSAALPPFGLASMTEYRIYILDEVGKIVGGPRIIRCDNDDTALIWALKFTAGQAFEIWHDERLVISVPADR